VPELSVLLAVNDDDRYVGAAIESVLHQTFRDLELIVVDDASTDSTPAVLRGFDDPRVVVLTNEQQLGLAPSLNRGLERAAGRYVARLDADDIALPTRFERQLAALPSGALAVIGSAIWDLDEDGRRGRVHRMPVGSRAVRWHALFSSPFFHPTVVFDRETLGDLRYDTGFLESEDYDLWTRLLATGAEGGNVDEALVLKRVHAGQASLARSDVQRSFQRRVALREIERVAPSVDAEAAWSFAIGGSRDARPYRALLTAFEAKHGTDREVRLAAARRLARAGDVLAAARLSLGAFR
jgi:glycosyltransferase involved in cell wall biosynthesis